MKNKRILSLTLALVLLLGCVSIFSACKKTDGIVTIKGKEVEVDVSEYEVVYGRPINTSEFTTTYTNRIYDFADRLSAYVGDKYTAYAIDRTRSTADSPEILIGDTGRAQSDKVKSGIKGDGFAIAVVDNKIVITGTTNLLTLMALEYFCQNYLPTGEEQGKVLAVHKSAKADAVEQITLGISTRASDGNLDEAVAKDYVYVYSQLLGKLPAAYAGTGSDLATSTYKDYEQAAADEIVELMQKNTGIGSKYFPIKSDKKTYDKEVLIGRVDRDETRAVLQGLATNEYAVEFGGNKVMVTGWSEAAVRGAVTVYQDLLKEGTYKAPDGTATVTAPLGLRLTGSVNENWKLDFPKPEGEGIKLYNTMDANDNAYQFLYTGDGVNAAAYKAYCEQLKAAGYTAYMPENEIEGSYFSTFINRKEGTVLHVSFNAFAHQDDFGEFDWVLTKTKTGEKDPYDYDPCLRIVSVPTETAHLPVEGILQPTTYEWKTNSMVTTMPLGSGAVGLVYIVTLEDGSFIVFDGGAISETGAEYDRLWKTLSALHEKIYGAKPSVYNPVRIAAWVLTHAHGDHYRVFLRMSKDYGLTGLLKMDYMIANFPAAHSAYTIRSAAGIMDPEDIAVLQKNFKGGFKYIKAHAGQKFYLANCEVEVLMTWEDHNPLTPNNTNETNTVLRFALSTQKDPTAPELVQIWTGDANRWQSRYMCAMYGDYLKADMVSIAHHGNNGCEIDFYEMVDPTAVWWPHNVGSIKSYLNPSKKDTDFRHQVDQYICNDLASVKYIFASGASNNSLEEKYFTTVEITAEGAQYEDVFDIMTGEPLGVLYTAVSSPSALMKK